MIKREIEYNRLQDGPSLESSSYLNVSLRYLGPCVVILENEIGDRPLY